MSMIKRLLATAGVFVMAMMAKAADYDMAGVSMDTNLVHTAGTKITDGMTSILQQLAPMVVAVVVGGVAIWAIPRIVGALKSAFTSGKGR